MKGHGYAVIAESKYALASLAQNIAIIVIAPFALFGEISKVCRGVISAKTCLKNIAKIPLHIILSIFKMAFAVLQIASKIIEGTATMVGFLAWHGGESVVRLIKGTPHTVLSNDPYVRQIVYKAAGLTMLAAAAVFVPLAPLQLAGLPIIMGSIYGTINNQFTVRECPEYYTMGHYYDGTSLEGHAVKTNHLVIKPMVTGSYATTFVTKVSGVLLSASGTIPYTAAILPVPLAAAMIGGVTLISLVAAHIFSMIKKKATERNLESYANLIGIQWSEQQRNQTWNSLEDVRRAAFDAKLQSLAGDPIALENFKNQVGTLSAAIEGDILDPKLPLKYLSGWQANSTRNGVGYFFAGGGTLAITISTIFIRIFAL